MSSVLILLSIISVSLAAVGIGRATVHPSHPDQCYNAKTDSYYSPGESWQLDGCGQASCAKYSSASSQLMISYESCGLAAVQPPCYLVQDNTKPYPDCCHQVVCPESNDDDEMFTISSEEDWGSARNNRSEESESASASSSSSSVNDLTGTAVHFSLGRNNEKETNAIDRDERNDLQSLEEPSEESFEIIQPRELPPRFQFAVFDDDIGNGHEQRFNEVDAQEDYQLV